MLRSVFAIALVAACHPAPAPTTVRASPIATSATVPAATSAPVRQDPDVLDVSMHGPLREVLATGHECRQDRPGPIDDTPVPLTERRVMLEASPAACERHGDRGTPYPTRRNHPDLRDPGELPQ